MSVSYEVQDSDTEDIQKQRWFFTLLSESQAETILNEGEVKQTRSSRFLVSNLPSSKDYRISIKIGKPARKKNTSRNVEHIIISYNEEDQSYGIKGQNRCQSVVEVIRNFVSSCDYALEPFSGSLEVKDTDVNKSILMSLTSMDSSQFEEPPPYSAAMQYPTDKRPLPQIKTKLDPNKAQEAQLESSIPIGTSSSEGYYPQDHERGCCWGACDSDDDDEQGCCWGACDSGNDCCDTDGAGWLRRICIMIMLVTVVIVVGVFCGCCLIAIIACVLGCNCCNARDELFPDED